MADAQTEVATPGAPCAPTLSVAEAVALAGRGVRLAAPGSLWVQGEVSGLVKSRAGHWYWSLSGDGVRLPARALRRQATAIGEVLRGAGVVLADGLTVRVFGSLIPRERVSTCRSVTCPNSWLIRDVASR
jgi:exonuclease VII large subunit